jgi:hypothetical protein
MTTTTGRARFVTAAALALGLSSLGCGAATPLNDVTSEPLPDDAKRIEQANLLATPVADAEALLGREVHTTEDGNWTIADNRRPGCTVKVKRVPAAFEVEKRIDLSNVTSLAAGFRELVRASAKYGEAEKIDIAVKNKELLEAERVDGECGELVVSQVLVGRGKRTFLRKKDVAGEVSGSIGGLTPTVGHSASGELSDTLEWESDQAYGFNYTEAAKHASLGLKLAMPSIVDHGQELNIELTTNRKAWLVVFYVDANGEGAVLWPSAEEPEATAEPGKPATLPSATEKAAGIALEARVAEEGKPSRETLVAYAFENKADFDRVKPAAGASDTDGPALAADLTKKIEELPASSWSRAMVHYVIRP